MFSLSGDPCRPIISRPFGIGLTFLFLAIPLVGAVSADDTFQPLSGPRIQMIAPGTAEIVWQSERPSRAIVDFGPEYARSQTDDRLSAKHRVILDELSPPGEMQFRIRSTVPGESERVTRTYTFDASFEYNLPTIPEVPSPYEENEQMAQAAEHYLQESGWQAGYAVVLGAMDGQLAYELAKRSQLQVVVVEPDAERVAAMRAALLKGGVYGGRVAVHQGSLETLKLSDYLANLVVSETLLREGEFQGSIEEARRILRPAGGVAYLNANDPKRPFRRPPLPGAGQWTHQYGEADNTACSKDELVKGDVDVLWWGQPGPRPMPDRGGRNPSPLSVGGFLFTQGDRILFGQDSYNGTIYWSMMIPEMRRSNIPRDCGNMVAAADRLYVVVGQHCLGIHPRTGEVVTQFAVPGNPDRQEKLDWGYIGYVDNVLVGSAIARGGAYQADSGEWYEDYQPTQINKVAANFVFGLDRHSGRELWRHDQGVVVNSTLTLSDSEVFLVDSRNPAAKVNPNARKPHQQLAENQHLVSLNLQSGKTNWERTVNFRACEFMTYMAYSQDRLIVAGTSKDKTFHHYGLDATTGDLKWHNQDGTKKTHHSGHLDHMVVIGDRIYSNLKVLDLETGETAGEPFAERRGCGIMAGSNHMMFFRDHFHSLWDLETNRRRELPGIRSGCWLGIVPAGGMVLAPESSSGCSCTHSIQTSVGFRPVHVASDVK